MDSKTARPVPHPRGEERRYFSDLREHRMPFYRCSSCLRVFARPHERCTGCAATPLERQWSNGHGVVYSYTTLHRPGHPWFTDRVPYTIALVDFAEGFRGLADLAPMSCGTDPYIGQPVRAEFEDISDEIALVHFMAMGN